MKYQLIAADIDGTLINSKRELTAETVRAIKEAQAAGVLFTLSTGRPIMGIRQFRELLSPNVPLITYNGGMVLHSDDETIIFSAKLQASSVREIYRLGLERDTTIVIWVKNKLYVNRINDAVLNYRTITMETPHLIEDLSLLENDVTKMIWIDSPENNQRFLRELEGSLPGVNYSTSTPILLEFMDASVSKAVALEKVADSLNIPMESVIAVGDGLNDLPMIAAAGCGVAMANGHEKTKAAAKYITHSNDDEGIAFMIDSLIFGRHEL